jgi:hypothetical protein
LKGGSPRVVHVDVHAPDQTFVPQIDWNAGFRATAAQFCTSLIDPAFKDQWQPLEVYLRKLMGKPPYPPVFEALYGLLLRISHRCWAGKQEFISRDDLLAMFNELRGDDRLPEQVISDLVSLL